MKPARTFPADFVWGAATSAYQIEGAVQEDGRGQTVWDVFAHTPGAIEHGHTGDIACDHYHRVAHDIDLMVELGLQTYRFSIAWARVMPDGRTRVNHAGLAWYHRLVDLLLEHDIAPCPTLFHWDLPMGLEEIGGFRERDTSKWFADYAALMAQELGDRVTMWATFNEPWCYAYLGHASGVHAPGATDPHAAVAAAHHQLLAHGLGVQAMRAERGGLALGLVLNPSNVVSTGSPQADPSEVEMIDGLATRWWMDAVFQGEYPADVIERLDQLAQAVQPGDNETIAQPVEWLGINYYCDTVVRQASSRGEHLREFPTVQNVTTPSTATVHTDMGWPITPDGFTELLVRLHSDYPGLPPIYITENGAAYDDPLVDGRCGDDRRVDYLDLHLRAVLDAIDEGVDIRGYYAWSFVDNFEWAHGYEKRFGLVHIDFDTLERTPRDSGRWYRDVITRHGLAGRDG